MPDMNDRALRALDLAKQIKKLGDTPAEYGSEHQAAQSTLASLGYQLAEIVLTPADEPGQ